MTSSAPRRCDRQCAVRKDTAGDAAANSQIYGVRAAALSTLLRGAALSDAASIIADMRRSSKFTSDPSGFERVFAVLSRERRLPRSSPPFHPVYMQSCVVLLYLHRSVKPTALMRRLPGSSCGLVNFDLDSTSVFIILVNRYIASDLTHDRRATTNPRRGWRVTEGNEGAEPAHHSPLGVRGLSENLRLPDERQMINRLAAVTSAVTRFFFFKLSTKSLH
jgi:hypothetical protein